MTGNLKETYRTGTDWDVSLALASIDSFRVISIEHQASWPLTVVSGGDQVFAALNLEVKRTQTRNAPSSHRFLEADPLA
jgi:hypothetical protein